MKYLVTLSLLLLPTIVFAQAPSTEVALKLTLSEAELIWNGLRKLPVEQVEQLMNKVRQQVSEQTQPKPDQPKAVDSKPADDKKEPKGK